MNNPTTVTSERQGGKSTVAAAIAALLRSFKFTMQH